MGQILFRLCYKQRKLWLHKRQQNRHPGRGQTERVDYTRETGRDRKRHGLKKTVITVRQKERLTLTDKRIQSREESNICYYRVMRMQTDIYLD